MCMYLTIDSESSQSIVNYNILLVSFVFLDYIYGKLDLILKLKKIKLKFLGISCQIFYFHNREEKVHVNTLFRSFHSHYTSICLYPNQIVCK